MLDASCACLGSWSILDRALPSGFTASSAIPTESFQSRALAVAHPANGPDAPPGQYRAQLQLQGAAPMQLRASAQARLPAPPDLQAQLPQTPQLLHLQALASLSGTLAGAQAQLQLTRAALPLPFRNGILQSASSAATALMSARTLPSARSR